MSIRQNNLEEASQCNPEGIIAHRVAMYIARATHLLDYNEQEIVGTNTVIETAFTRSKELQIQHGNVHTP